MTVHLSWIPGLDGGHPQWFVVRYREAMSEWTSKTYNLSIDQHMTSLDITGLIPSTKYEFEITAQNIRNSSPVVFVSITTKGTYIKN